VGVAFFARVKQKLNLYAQRPQRGLSFSMYDHETFRNAPIMEAVLDFSVVFERPPTLDDMARYENRVTTEFPIRRKRRMFDTSVRIVDDEPLLENSEKHFWAFNSRDGKYIAQIRTDGFAFSRLNPYTSWADSDAWEKYFSEFSPLSIEKVCVKYSNRIELPNPVSIADYFNTRILLPDGLPQQLSYANFSFSVQDKKADVSDVFFIIDRRSSTTDKLSAVFQIEARHERTISVGDTEALSNILSGLRDFKNRIFFCSLTERTKAMLNEPACARGE
jgi:uncharacterized protein (TIGR04255 family)